jgi:hypothetical protein
MGEYSREKLDGLLECMAKFSMTGTGGARAAAAPAVSAASSRAG